MVPTPSPTTANSSMHEWINEPLHLPNVDLDPGGVHLPHEHDGLITELWQRTGTLVLPLRGEAALIDEDRRLALISPAEIDQLIASTESTEPLKLYLGRSQTAEGVADDGILVADDGMNEESSEAVPVIAALLDDGAADALTTGKWADLRALGHLLDSRDTRLLTRATALANWHKANTFSPRSGRMTTLAKSGWSRIDTGDGTEHFPRTDPAVIVAVTDVSDRILLASNTAWDERIFSLIAGYVDPGESLEQAVVREVLEESGMRVGSPRYLGSQPWPFPASLMIGFAAQLESSVADQQPDGVEIRALRWFSRHELKAAVEAGEIIVPSGVSISRAIIHSWYGGEL